MSRFPGSRGDSRTHPSSLPPSLSHRPRPLKFWPFALVGLSSIAIAKISLHPRLKLTKDAAGWTLRYEYAKAHDPGPRDKGLEFPAPRDVAATEEDLARKREMDNRKWILDTGATSHMCTNRELMHSYTELPWGQQQSGFVSASGTLSHVVGIGSVTLDTQARVLGKEGAGAGSGSQQQGWRNRVTLNGVQFFPTKGVNLMSWSMLKRTATKHGVRLRLVEGEDWLLHVVKTEKSWNGVASAKEKETVVMSFRPERGLYVLVQPDGMGQQGKKS
ncbi:uncharacterized protein HMPREF1541_03982 [Cyphellophora europaea CBS 101466]|uniref:Retrovirus-related Pol polyprotein from transposon TNT 1-94-like beta-barrel domain-containing protein n=1 Tax=Cyphellophora europaea (strain CBS 101466) TaxID=1220924 RepID=W2S1W9_CYPE1|nr:uncharacterized protein HMPREF1541_03982 [Cyphellophora europaea CBS 101466]ETN42043.1 hypothetical protein HMPREF1541_03982 [Cyphellophora europaea CBS 101466]